jgi:hypothetical protein
VAFTVGWGGNSLASVAYADAYFADRATPAWSGDNTTKQGALVRATDYVRALFLPRFDPDKVNALLLPDTLLQAVCQYALVELTTPGGLAPAGSASGATTVVTKEKIGPIETSYSVLAGSTPLPAGTRRPFPVADALIAVLLLSTVGANRTYR